MVLSLFASLLCTVTNVAKAQFATAPSPAIAAADSQVLDEIQIWASPYNVSSEATATKSDTPTYATPFSVDVVPRHLLDDMGVFSIEEAMRSVGAHGTDTSGWGALAYFLRGFQVNSYYVDGIKQARFTQLDPALIEQVDVLRGAAGSLYGRIDPGGIVNITTNKPQSSPAIFADQSVGSYGAMRTVFDASGPVTGDGALLYRAIAAYEYKDSFRDDVFHRHFTFSPALAWVPNASNRVDVQFIYQNFTDTVDFGIPLVPAVINPNSPNPGGVVQNRFLNAPFSLYVGPIDDQIHAQTYELSVSATHVLDEHWSLKPTIGWLQLNQPGNEGGFTGWANQPANGWGGTTPNLANIYEGSPSNFFQHQEFAELDANGNFQAWEMQHAVLLSTEAEYAHYAYQVLYSPNSPNPIDVTNPVYQSIYQFTVDPTTAAGGWGNQLNDEWFSATAQDQFQYGERLRGVLGVRFDHSHARSENKFGLCNSLCELVDSKWTPRIGVNFDATSFLALYASFASGYGAANPLALYDGSVAKSETSLQKEIGIKGHWFGERLVARATLFDLRKENVVTALPIASFPGQSCVQTVPGFSNLCYAQVGAEGSRGAEIELAGRLDERVSVNLYGEHVNAKILQGDSASLNSYPVGAALADVAHNSSSFWLEYDHPEGWSVGGGADALGPRPYDVYGTLQLPGFVRTNAMGRYRWKSGKVDVSVQLNLKNLTNVRTAYDIGWNGSGVIPSEGRAAYASVSAKWR